MLLCRCYSIGKRDENRSFKFDSMHQQEQLPNLSRNEWVIHCRRLEVSAISINATNGLLVFATNSFDGMDYILECLDESRIFPVIIFSTASNSHTRQSLRHSFRLSLPISLLGSCRRHPIFQSFPNIKYHTPSLPP